MMATREFSLDEYRLVTIRIVDLMDRALKIDTPNGRRYIPRSLLHGADDLRMEHIHKLPCDETVRVMEWKAEELGLA